MPIMTSWGCPFDCTFCSVTEMFGCKYRLRSTDNVIEELKPELFISRRGNGLYIEVEAEEEEEEEHRKLTVSVATATPISTRHS